jgi:hypothetical protein
MTDFIHPEPSRRVPVVQARSASQQDLVDLAAVVDNVLDRITLIERALGMVFEDIDTIREALFEEPEPEDTFGQVNGPVDTAESVQADREDTLDVDPDADFYDPDNDVEWAEQEALRLRAAAERSNELDREPGSPVGLNDVTEEDLKNSAEQGEERLGG